MGDFSPVLPLTAADAIALDVYNSIQIEKQNNAMLAIVDIHWFLERLAMAFTGDAGWNEKPSTVAQMAKNYAERKKLWDAQ